MCFAADSSYILHLSTETVTVHGSGWQTSQSLPVVLMARATTPGRDPETVGIVGCQEIAKPVGAHTWWLIAYANLHHGVMVPQVIYTD